MTDIVNTIETVQVNQTDLVPLGTLAVYGPIDVIQTANAMAATLADIIKQRRLYVTISGRQYVKVEGWSTLGAMLGILPREVEVTECENGDYLAAVELIRASDGAIIGRASSIVSSDEKLWQDRPRYARRSMAVTRATGKAFRLGFSWIMALAGYEPTPAEEMPGDYESKPKAKTLLLKDALKVSNSDNKKYGDMDNETLVKMREAVTKQLADNEDLPPHLRGIYEFKLLAMNTILEARGGR